MLPNDMYLGIDLSLTSPGFAVIRVIDRKPHLVALSSTKTEASSGSGKNKISYTDGERLKAIADHLMLFMGQHGDFKGVFKEKGFSRFATETQKLYKAHGVIEYILSDEKIEEVAPSSLKKIITGNGKATKKEVEQRVCEILNCTPSVFKNDDESDAAGVVLAILIKKNLIDVE